MSLDWLFLLDSEWSISSGSNMYTEMAEKYRFEDVLRVLADRYNLEWITLQGESYGAGIQKRDYSMKDHDFMGFNLIVYLYNKTTCSAGGSPSGFSPR